MAVLSSETWIREHGSANAGVNIELYDKKDKKAMNPLFKTALRAHSWLPLVDTKGARYIRFKTER